jgi:hypothetical protein
VLWDIEAVWQDATFYCASTDSKDSCPKAEPQEPKGFHLTHPYKQVTQAIKLKNKV